MEVMLHPIVQEAAEALERLLRTQNADDWERISQEAYRREMAQYSPQIVGLDQQAEAAADRYEAQPHWVDRRIAVWAAAVACGRAMRLGMYGDQSEIDTIARTAVFHAARTLVNKPLPQPRVRV